MSTEVVALEKRKPRKGYKRNKKKIKNIKKMNDRKKGIKFKKDDRREKGPIKALEFITPERFDASDDIKSLFGTRGNYDRWAKAVNLLAAQGPDIRKASESLNIGGLFSDSASETNKIVVDIDSETLIGIAASILSNAYNHGFRQESMSLKKDWYPYFAFLFIYNALKTVATGSQVDAPKVKVPDFLLEIFAAIAPKSGAQLGAGTLGYSWNLLNGTNTPGDAFLYPSSGTQYGNYNFFVATSNLESGYNIMVAPTYPSYTVSMGGEAFSALVTFMSKRLVGTFGKYRPYQAKDYNLEGTILERSVSAFSATSLVFGGGLIGGYASSLASLETTIKHRKLAVFSKDKSLDRGFRQHCQTGGDSNWLVCSMLLQQNRLEVKNPNYPVFAPVDFYEFADCLALALSQAFSNAYHAKDFNTSNLVDMGLTAVEYLVILRKVLMKNFSSTQYGVQSMRFYPTTLGSTDDFIPFLCNSAGSSSSNNATIKLPLFAIENLNALRARAVYPSVNPRTMKQIDNYPRYYIPVLGIYTNSTFNEDKYKYLDADDNLQSLFSTGNATINLVDGAINQNYVDMDCSPKITTDMDKFNDVMGQLSAFIQQPQMYTGDPGCIPLTVVADCRMIIEKKGESEKKKKKTTDDSQKKKKKGPKIVTYEKLLVATISQQIPIVDITNIKKSFVCPEYRIFTSSAGVGSITIGSSRSYTAEMWVEYEGQSYSASTDGDYTDMVAIRKQWVANCVKNQFGDDNTIVKQLLTLTKQGKAGLLGSLVSAFGGELSNAAFRTLGSFIPY